MSEQSSAVLAVEQAVAEYLHAHPDFFERHLKLLASLRIPHPARPAVSLIERQLDLLREQNTRLHKKIAELVEVARDNDRVAHQLQRLALILVKLSEFEEKLDGVASVLQDEFNADFVTLRLPAGSSLPGLARQEALLPQEAFALFEPLLRSGRPQCGLLTGDQAQRLFPEVAAEVASAAVVPLGGRRWQGLLALGSRDDGRFHPAMGTLFLVRLGELVSHALEPHLGASPGRADSVPPAQFQEGD